jgi:DNA-binding LacI/PurR family transcriptional regulator
VTLRALATHLGLSLTTVSVVVSDAPAAQAIPPATRKRILAAASELHYRPNYFARSLRKKHSMSVGVLVSEIGEGYFTLVMNGVEEYLVAAKYSYLLAAHYWKPKLMEEYPKMLLERSVDGLLLVNTPPPARIHVPIVAISGHQAVAGVTNIQLNQKLAARLALKHLADLGHGRVAFMKGQEQTVDTPEVRPRNGSGLHPASKGRNRGRIQCQIHRHAHLHQLQKVNETPPPTRCWRIAESKIGPTKVSVASSNSIPLMMLAFDLVQKSGCEVRVSR